MGDPDGEQAKDDEEEEEEEDEEEEGAWLDPGDEGENVSGGRWRL